MPYADIEYRRKRQREKYKEDPVFRKRFLDTCRDNKNDALIRWKGQTKVKGKGICYNEIGQIAQHYIAALKAFNFEVFDTGLSGCPFDLILKSPNGNFLVLVSTRYQIHTSKTVKNISKFLGMELLIVHVKPDLSWYCETLADERNDYLVPLKRWKKERPEDWQNWKDGRSK
jgi:hypothetical protein